jgi:purine-cytosine permease-like protein
VVIPLVTHGVSVISRLQMWTQPLWLFMLVLSFVYVLVRDPAAFAGVMHYAGDKDAVGGFNLHIFGAGLSVGIALIKLVVISQLKINVTNAYAGSLAWSNFFSRLAHSHPGRVVWVMVSRFLRRAGEQLHRLPEPQRPDARRKPGQRQTGAGR